MNDMAQHGEATRIREANNQFLGEEVGEYQAEPTAEPQPSNA
jgi:hypothetical protein